MLNLSLSLEDDVVYAVRLRAQHSNGEVKEMF